MQDVPGPQPPGPDPRSLTPELAEAERTYREMLFRTFAFELRLGHRLGFVRALASPRVAGVLAATGRMEHDPSRRATDTGLFMYSMLFHGLDSEIGRRAVVRLNGMHAGLAIPDDDYAWVLGTWFLPGLAVADRYGWRAPTDAERRAVIDWHRELGARMGLRGLPGSLAAFQEHARRYELEHLGASAAGERLRAAVLGAAVRSLPRPLRGAGVRAGAALVDAEVRRALALPEPGAVTRRLVPAVLGVRAAVRRRRGPGAPWFVPGAPRRDHPHGYTVEDLGPGPARPA